MKSSSIEVGICIFGGDVDSSVGVDGTRIVINDIKVINKLNIVGYVELLE